MSEVEAIREQLVELLTTSRRLSKDVFQAFDADGSGLVDEQEFYHAMLTLGIDCNSEQANALFSTIDLDGSGSIDYRELQTTLKVKNLELSTAMLPGAVDEIGMESRNVHALRRGGPTAVGSQRVLGSSTLNEQGSDLADQLMQLLGDRWTRVRDLFESFDEDGNGLIDSGEFHVAVAQLDLHVERAQTDALFAKWDTDLSGKIDYREMSRLLRPDGSMKIDASLLPGGGAVGEIGMKSKTRIALRRGGPTAVGSQRVLGSSASLNVDAPDLAEQLTTLLDKSWTRVRDLFASFDEDGSGMIDRKEFYHAVAQLGLHVDRAQTDALFAKWDTDGSGQIDYREMQRLLRPGNSVVLDASLYAGAAGEITTESNNIHALRKSTAGQIHSGVLGAVSMGESSIVENPAILAAELASALDRNMARVRDLFSEWDKSSDGKVDKKEFRIALKVLGVNASKEAADALFLSFDKDGSGEVDYKELHKAVKASGFGMNNRGPGAPAGAAKLLPGQRRVRLGANPIVPVRHLLLEVLPRCGPQIAKALSVHADREDCVVAEHFVTAIFEVGQRVDPTWEAKKAPFAQLGVRGRSAKTMGQALNELFIELAALDDRWSFGGTGREGPVRVPIKEIPARLRKLKQPRKPPRHSPLGGSSKKSPRSPRAQRAKLVAAAATAEAAPSLPSPRPPPQPPSPMFSSGKQTERKQSSPKNEKRIKLPLITDATPIELQVAAQLSQELKDYQARGRKLRIMIDKLEADPEDWASVQSALNEFIREKDPAASPRNGQRQQKTRVD